VGGLVTTRRKIQRPLPSQLWLRGGLLKYNSHQHHKASAGNKPCESADQASYVDLFF
jgi:hypothetical protein